MTGYEKQIETIAPVGDNLKGPQTIFLHGQSQVLVPGAVLIPKDTNREVPFNGDILAKISLPSDNPADLDKTIALVDFGTQAEDGKWPFLIRLDGVERPGWGRTKSRYALMGMNYDPVSHTITYAELNEGNNYFGRGESLANYMLGIQHDQIGNKAVSKEHFTVNVSKKGKIMITDHSTNGTVLEFPVKASDIEVVGSQKARLKNIGKSILKREK